MKFTELVEKFETLANKKEQGNQIKPEKLQELRELLADKKFRYEKKLEVTPDPEKSKKLETRLKVVSAQLEKLNLLSTGVLEE